MNSEQFRKHGKVMVDYIADYLDNIKTRRVTPNVEPGYLRELISSKIPEEGENFESILADIEDKIMPGITHWQHPGFHAYFPAGNSYPSILADMLSDAIGCVGFSWAASPACAELESIVVDWMAKMVGLPPQFSFSGSEGKGGGALQGSASDCILVAMLAARSAAMNKMKEDDPLTEDGVCLSKMVAYCSKQAHSSVEKAALISCITIRQLSVDDKFSMRGDTVLQAIKRDREAGLVPMFVCSTLGTTTSCAFDNLKELGPVCAKEGVWLHVDAAYAGSAFLCPEFRHLLDGVEFATSFNMNPNKWMLVNFDCSIIWVKNSNFITDALNVDPLYLRHKNSGTSLDYRHWGIPLSRRFRSLKLWFVIRTYGLSGLQEYIRRHCSLAKKFETLVKSDNRFEVMGQVTMGLVCFRLKGPNRFSEQLLTSLNESGKLHMVPSSMNGRYIIRYAICYEHASEEDINESWNIITDITNTIVKPNEIAGEQPAPDGEVISVKSLRRLNLKRIDRKNDICVIDEGVPYCPISELQAGRYRAKSPLRSSRQRSLHLW